MKEILQNIWCFHQVYFWQSLTIAITRMTPIRTKTVILGMSYENCGHVVCDVV